MKGYNDILCDTVTISEGPEGFALALSQKGAEVERTTMGLRGAIMYLESVFDAKRDELMELASEKAKSLASFDEEDADTEKVSMYFKRKKDATAFFDYVTKDLRLEEVLGVTVFQADKSHDYYRVIIDGFKGD